MQRFNERSMLAFSYRISELTSTTGQMAAETAWSAKGKYPDIVEKAEQIELLLDDANSLSRQLSILLVSELTKLENEGSDVE